MTRQLNCAEVFLLIDRNPSGKKHDVTETPLPVQLT